MWDVMRLETTTSKKVAERLSPMDLPLISIVLPTYNRAEYLDACLINLFEQDYPNFEIVVVDDGSTDKTETVVAKYLKNQKVRYFKYSPNRGACFARNYGVSRARGSLIAFQDSDDFWNKNKLTREYGFLAAEKADLVFCGMERRDVETDEAFYYPMDLDPDSDITLSLLLKANCISTQTILITTSAARRISFDASFKRYQDWDYALQAVKAGLCIRYLAESLVLSVVQKNSISATVGSAEAYEHLFEKYLEEYNSNPASCAYLFQSIARAYRGISSEKTKKYLIGSLRIKFSLKVVLKLIASVIGIY